MATVQSTKTMGWNAFGQQSLHVIDIREALTYYSILARKTRKRKHLRNWASILLSAMDECYPLFKNKTEAEELRQTMTTAHALASFYGSDKKEIRTLITSLGRCNFKFMEGTQEEYLYSIKEKQTREQIINRHLDGYGKEEDDGL